MKITSLSQQNRLLSSENAHLGHVHSCGASRAEQGGAGAGTGQGWGGHRAGIPPGLGWDRAHGCSRRLRGAMLAMARELGMELSTSCC